jgi:hypothetical protein
MVKKHRLEYEFLKNGPVISSGEGANTVVCRYTNRWTTVCRNMTLHNQIGTYLPNNGASQLRTQ